MYFKIKAYIAETVDIDQCIDLYRHAVELSLNVRQFLTYYFTAVALNFYIIPDMDTHIRVLIFDVCGNSIVITETLSF